MKAILQRDYFDWLFKIPQEDINVQEASQSNWESSLALHIFVSFVAQCVKVIFLRQDDVDVKQPCSKQKGWGVTAAAEALNFLCLKRPDCSWGLQKVQALFPKVCIPTPTPSFLVCLFVCLSAQENPLFQMAERVIMEVFCTDLSPR